jgi:hypothetical protein
MDFLRFHPEISFWFNFFTPGHLQILSKVCS